jgi:catechol 2,3-dioxygenase-like lactoylglutathione lyase family enzyme
MERHVTVRMDNVLVVVDDLEAAIAFFRAIGMEVEGRAIVEGEAVDRLVGIDGVRSEIVMMRTPDGQSRIELDKFHAPDAVRAETRQAPVNALGIRRFMFAVDDLDGVLARLRSLGAELVGEVTEYGGYRMCYLRGPDRVMVALTEQVD